MFHFKAPAGESQICGATFTRNRVHSIPYKCSAVSLYSLHPRFEQALRATSKLVFGVFQVPLFSLALCYKSSFAVGWGI